MILNLLIFLCLLIVVNFFLKQCYIKIEQNKNREQINEMQS
jgi:hypothetical protein